MILTYHRAVKNFLALALTCLSLFTALLLRFDFNVLEFFSLKRFALPLLLLLVARQCVHILLDLGGISWRYVSIPDLPRVLKGYLASSMLFATLIFIFGSIEFPRSVLAIEFCIAFLGDLGLKFIARSIHEYRENSSAHPPEAELQDILVVGGGFSGHFLVKTLLFQRNGKYRPVGVLDDLDRLKLTAVHGVPVVGKLAELPDVLRRWRTIKAVIIAVPSLSSEKVHAIESTCAEHCVLLMRLQGFEDIACLEASPGEHSLTIESLLDKPAVFRHEREVADRVAHHVVLVTGAGGSIGSEICSQLLELGARRVIFFDNCEYNLYQIDRKLGQRFGAERCRSVIGDVSSPVRLREILEQERPDIVFHAAAFKHVPLMESNPKEAFRNNVLGLRCVLETCEAVGIQRIVFISTDKAVDPCNVMGATKRLGEMLVRHYADTRRATMQVATVRFGNVINSAGSVIPLFKEQILRGGPITVTHPEVTRFFMSIPEAVRLVLTAGLLGAKGQTYVLDMGKKLKVVDVARRMLSLFGRRDIEIVYTGLRPGEKLTEELTGPHEMLRCTPFGGVFELYETSPQRFDVVSTLSYLERRLLDMTDREFANALISGTRESFKEAAPQSSLVA